MVYGFDDNGGFVVLDREARVAEYAYPTSTYAERAKRRPESVARLMVHEREIDPQHDSEVGFLERSFPGWFAERYERFERSIVHARTA